jgi:hypothetical protein
MFAPNVAISNTIYQAYIRIQELPGSNLSRGSGYITIFRCLGDAAKRVQKCTHCVTILRRSPECYLYECPENSTAGDSPHRDSPDVNSPPSNFRAQKRT